MLARVRILTEAGPRLGMASVYIKYLSAKALVGGYGTAGRLSHPRQDPLCPKSGSWSPRLSQPPSQAGSLHPFSFPLPSPSPAVSRQSVEGQVRPCGGHRLFRASASGDP